jgi:hypothetical protein
MRPTLKQRLAGTAPRAVDAARGLDTQRLRAGLTSVAPLALGRWRRRRSARLKPIHDEVHNARAGWDSA